MLHGSRISLRPAKDEDLETFHKAPIDIETRGPWTLAAMDGGRRTRRPRPAAYRAARNIETTGGHLPAWAVPVTSNP
jgi:hypothetical protein